jgi:hypothetical protein
MREVIQLVGRRAARIAGVMSQDISMTPNLHQGSGFVFWGVEGGRLARPAV